MQKIGRNDPCPCGSGKKYKKCCLAKSWSPPGKEESLRLRLFQDILAFAKKNYRDMIDEAYDYFWDDFYPEEHLDAHTLELANLNFWDWLVHDWMPEEEEESTLIDLYIKGSRNLRPEEKEMLLRMNDTVISLYEVQEVFPEEGLILKDLLLGDKYSVREKAATRSLRKWDIFATRLLRLDDNIIMTGCVYPYPVRVKEATIDHLKKYCRDHRKKCPGSTMRDFLKWNGDLFNYYWYENIREPFRPVLVTTSGEPVVFCNAIFEVKDRDGVLSRLRKMDELEDAGEGVLRWFDETKGDGSATILGTVRLKNSTLRLECNSKERLDKGKALLLEGLGDLITHKADTIQDPYQAMNDAPETIRKQEREIPKEVEQEFYTRFMKEYYEKWLDERLPVLKDRTPLETVKRPWGKKKVAELLKSIENMEEHKKQKGEPWCDTSWLWKRLGIER